MLQVGRYRESAARRIDGQGCRIDRCALLTARRNVLFTAVALAVVLCSQSEALAHISTRSPYRRGVAEENWALFSNAVFVVGQLLGWAYLAVVLQTVRRWSLWVNIIAAFLMQLAIAAVLLIAGVISFIMAADLTSELHVIATGFEIVGVARPEIVSRLLLHSAATFAVGWGLSLLLLLVMRGMRDRWRVALFHTLVFHPFAFPVGPLLGLMHALYCSINARKADSGCMLSRPESARGE